MSRTRRILTAILVLLLVGVAIAWVQQRNSANQATVRVCIPRFASSALFAIAHTQDFFADENLQVDLEVQELGMTCIKKISNSEIEFAVAYLTPVARAFVNNAPLVVLSEVHSSIHNTSIIFSKPKSKISQPKDLAGKRIALVPGTNAETLLRLYLMAHGIAFNEVQLIASTQADIPLLLQSGKADAAVIWEPILSRIKSSGGAGEYLTLESSFYTEFSTVASLSGPKGPSNEIQTRMLKALYKAQKFIQKNPEQSRNLTISFLKLDPKELTSEVWGKVRYSLGLSAVLRSMLTEEATLIKKAEGQPSLASKELQKFIFAAPLRELNAELVTFE